MPRVTSVPSPAGSTPSAGGVPDGPLVLPGLALSRATVDRAAERRRDEPWLSTVWASTATRVLVVADGRVHASLGPPARLRWMAPPDAPEGERYLLGVDAEGVARFAVAAPALPGDEGRWQEGGLRDLGALLDDEETGLLVHAVALEQWHARHRHCPRCGAATEVVEAGHVRRCPRDGSDHYPRTDPAVIMTVVDGDGRLLLGHQASWPAGRFSALAGFVEPGESLERAVAREVLEEVGVVVADAMYLGSQPWPFPASLMLGFQARALTTDIRTDDEEITEARWFTRDELASAVASGSVRLPPRVSIARRLVEHWYGAELVDEGTWR